MPRNALLMLIVVAVLSAVLEWAGPAAAAAGERWRRPLPGGAVAGSFTFERAVPYVRGRRRGVDFSGPPGAPVLAACTGTVTHAGRVPRFGRGVTLRCGGGLVATELGLARTGVRPGAAVAAGAPVGRLGSGGVLRLGARRAGDRQGYVDPLALLVDRAPDVAPAPPPAPPRRASRRRPLPPVSPRTAPVPRAAPATLPVSVLAGLALLVAGAAGGTTARRRRRRRRSPAVRSAGRAMRWR